MARIEVEADIDIVEYLDEVNEGDLKDELEDRGFTVSKGKPITEMSPGEETKEFIKRLICDKHGLSYHTSDDEIIRLIGQTFA